MIQNQRKGFTLIELLIVIGIIGILAAAVIVVLNPAELLAQARDGTRLSDIDSVESAISLYLADTDSPELDNNPATTTTVRYESNASITCAGTCTDRAVFTVDGLGWVSVPLDGISGGSPLPRLPQDPTNDASYGYVYAANDLTNIFELNARLESERHRDKMTTDGGDDNICGTWTATTCWYEQGTNLNLLNI